MEKRRWQERPGSPAPPSTPPRSTPPPTGPPRSGGPKGEWRDRGDRPEKSGRARRAITGFFALAAILAVVMFLVTKFVPVPKPSLRTLAAEYRSAAIGFNAFATRDAQLLKNQNPVLDTDRANGAALDAETIRKEIAALADIHTSVNWFSWEKTTALVFINAVGAVLPGEAGQPVPVLLAENFAVPTARDAPVNAVPVADVFDSILKCGADWKVVVLDCQRLNHNWPMGMIRNDFVKESLGILEARYADRQGFFVMFSCADGQVSWVDRQLRQSVFAYYLAKGLYEDAQKDRDSKVTLAELFSYVGDNVRAWCGRNRADRQDPVLFPDGRDTNHVQLIAKRDEDRFVEPADAMSEPALAEPPDELRAAWRNYYELSTRFPYLEQPESWRELEDRLLVAERFWLAGELELAKTETSHAAEVIGRLTSPGTSGLRGSSLPMDEFLGGRSAGFSDLVQKVLGGGASLEDAAGQIQRTALAAAQRPIEAHLVCMLVQTLGELKLDPATELSQQAQGLIELRRSAERSAVPGGDRVVAPHVARWVRPLVERGDRHRRLLEDRLFADSAARVQLGKLPADAEADQMLSQAFRPDDQPEFHPRLRGRALELYMEADRHGQVLARAYRLHYRMLAQLPHLCKLLAARAWQQEAKEFRDRFEEPIERLLELAGGLSQALATSPPADRTALATQVKQVQTIADAIGPLADSLSNDLAKQMRDLGGKTDPPDNQTIWHQLDYVLEVPFIASSTDPDDAARNRMNLLKRVRQNLGSEGTGTAAAATGGATPSTRSSVQELATFAGQLYGLATSDDVRSGRPLSELTPTQLGEWVASQWRMIYQLAVPGRETETTAPDYATLARAERALRLLDGRISGPSGGSPRGRLRALARAEFFAWHAQRCLGDFWNRADRDQTDEPYYRRAAIEYLKLADQEGSRDTKLPAAVEAEVKAKLVLPAPKPQPSEVTLRGQDDEQTLRIDVEDAQKFPIHGLAALRLKTPESIGERSPRKQPSQWSAEYSLGIKSASSPSAQLESTLWFRGHRVPRVISARLVDDEIGDTVLYNYRLTDPPAVQIQLARDPQGFARILFVLDCSYSMDSKTSDGQTRMDVMKSVLREFADRARGTGIHVGVRLLGNQVRFDEEAEKRLRDEFTEEQQVQYMQRMSRDTSLALDVGRFEPDKFLKVVDGLDPVGATPLFAALADAARDLTNVQAREKRLVVISDGEDYFYDDDPNNRFRTGAVADGYRLVDRAFNNANVEIHAIGYHSAGAGLGQLRRVTQSHGGQCFEATNAKQLLDHILSLGGSYKFSAEHATDSSQRVQVEPLRQTPERREVTRGRFNLVVRDARGQTTDQIEGIRLDAAQVHRLIFTPPRTLDYAEPDFSAARRAKDSSDESYALRVIGAVPDGNQLQLTFSLFLKNFPKRDPAWRPPLVSAFVRTPENAPQPRFYAFHNLQPNEGGHHLPQWTVRLENWPADIRQGQLEVRWSDKDDSAEQIKLTNARNARLPDGIRMTHAEFEKDGRLKVKLRFPPDSKDDFHGWSIKFDESATVQSARQVYNSAERVYTGWFTFRQDGRPQEMTLHRPRGGQSIKLEFPVGAAELK
jgi:hypothetical protein